MAAARGCPWWLTVALLLLLLGCNTCLSIPLAAGLSCLFFFLHVFFVRGHLHCMIDCTALMYIVSVDREGAIGSERDAFVAGLFWLEL